MIAIAIAFNVFVRVAPLALAISFAYFCLHSLTGAIGLAPNLGAGSLLLAFAVLTASIIVFAYITYVINGSTIKNEPKDMFFIWGKACVKCFVALTVPPLFLGAAWSFVIMPISKIIYNVVILPTHHMLGKYELYKSALIQFSDFFVSLFSNHSMPLMFVGGVLVWAVLCLILAAFIGYIIATRLIWSDDSENYPLFNAEHDLKHLENNKVVHRVATTAFDMGGDSDGVGYLRSIFIYWFGMSIFYGLLLFLVQGNIEVHELNKEAATGALALAIILMIEGGIMYFFALPLILSELRKEK